MHGHLNVGKLHEVHAFSLIRILLFTTAVIQYRICLIEVRRHCSISQFLSVGFCVYSFSVETERKFLLFTIEPPHNLNNRMTIYDLFI